MVAWTRATYAGVQACILRCHEWGLVVLGTYIHDRLPASELVKLKNLNKSLTVIDNSLVMTEFALMSTSMPACIYLSLL